MEHKENDTDGGKQEHWDKNLSHHPFAHHKYHTDWPKSKPGPLQWGPVTNHLKHDTTCDVKQTAGIIHNLCVLLHTMGWKVQGSIPGGDKRFNFSKT